MAFIGLSSIYDFFKMFEGGNGFEKAAVLTAWVVGILSVFAYWSKRWFQCRDYFAGKTPFPKRKILNYAWFISFIVFTVCIFVLIVEYTLILSPEFLAAQAAIEGNPAVTAKFGAIKKIDWRAEGSINFGANRYGDFQFQVKGTLKEGLVRIEWQDQNGRFVPTEIDEITSPKNEEITSSEKLTVLWTK